MLRRIDLTAPGNASIGSSFNSPGRACQHDPNVLKEFDLFQPRCSLRSSPALGKLGVKISSREQNLALRVQASQGQKCGALRANNARFDDSSVERVTPLIKAWSSQQN
jgi:hypothetical protein